MIWSFMALQMGKLSKGCRKVIVLPNGFAERTVGYKIQASGFVSHIHNRKPHPPTRQLRLEFLIDAFFQRPRASGESMLIQPFFASVSSGPTMR